MYGIKNVYAKLNGFYFTSFFLLRPNVITSPNGMNQKKEILGIIGHSSKIIGIYLCRVRVKYDFMRQGKFVCAQVSIEILFERYKKTISI